MATCKQIKILDVEVSLEDIDRDVKNLIIRHLRPEWPLEEIDQGESLSGGILNRMLCYHLVTDANKEDAIVFRIYGNQAFSETQLREKEILTMQVAEKAGIFPPVLAIFSNGVAYKYAVGNNIEPHQLTLPQIYRCIAEALADLHSAQIDDVCLVDKHGKSAVYPRHQALIPRIKKYVEGMKSQRPDSLLQPRQSAVCIPLEEIDQEFKYVTGVLEDLDLEVGLMQCDCHRFNMVYNEEKNKVYLVDYEFAGFDYVVLDLAFFLRCGIYRNCFAHCTTKETRMSDAQTRDLIRYYLERRNTRRGHPRLVGADDIELTLVEIQIASLFLHLLWHILGRYVLDKGTDIPFQVLPLSKTEYYTERPHLESLVEHRQQIQKRLESSKQNY